MIWSGTESDPSESESMATVFDALSPTLVHIVIAARQHQIEDNES